MIRQQLHRYLHARWRSKTGEPVTTERRVAVYDEVTGDEGWADVHWSGMHVRLGFVRDAEGVIIDPNPTYV